MEITGLAKSAAYDLSGLRRLAAQPRHDDAAADKARREVSAYFAGIFLGQLFKIMRQSVSPASFGHGGAGERLFQQIADDEISMAAARQNAGGLAELVYRSLARQAQNGKQEVKT